MITYKINPPSCLIHPQERLLQCKRDFSYTCGNCRSGCMMCGQGENLPLDDRKKIDMWRTRPKRKI